MNQWLMLQRVKGPSFLLMFGVTALLDEFTSVSYGRSWPLYLILWGVLALAERAALAQADLEAYAAQGGAVPSASYAPPASATAIVPREMHDVSPSGSDAGEGRQ